MLGDTSDIKRFRPAMGLQRGREIMALKNLCSWIQIKFFQSFTRQRNTN